MKKLITLTIALAALLLTTGCDFDRLIVDQPPIIEYTHELPKPQTDAPVVKTDVDPFTHFTLEIPKLDYTDEWVILGNEYAQHLQNVFIDYLQIDARYFALEHNNERISIAKDLDNETRENFGIAVGGTYYLLSDEKIKTISDLKAEFCKRVEPNYADKLIADRSYLEYDSELYIFELDGGFIGISACYLEKYEIVDANNIVYTFVAVDDYTIDEDYDKPNFQYEISECKRYTISLTKSDDTWLITSCTDLLSHGYKYVNIFPNRGNTETQMTQDDLRNYKTYFEQANPSGSVLLDAVVFDVDSDGFEEIVSLSTYGDSKEDLWIGMFKKADNTFRSIGGEFFWNGIVQLEKLEFRSYSLDGMRHPYFEAYVNNESVNAVIVYEIRHYEPFYGVFATLAYGVDKNSNTEFTVLAGTKLGLMYLEKTKSL